MNDRSNRQKLGSGGRAKCPTCHRWNYQRARPQKDEVRPGTAAKMLGVSVSRIHQLMEADKLEFRRDGRLRFIKTESVNNRLAIQQNSTARERARHL